MAGLGPRTTRLPSGLTSLWCLQQCSAVTLVVAQPEASCAGLPTCHCHHSNYCSRHLLRPKVGTALRWPWLVLELLLAPPSPGRPLGLGQSPIRGGRFCPVRPAHPVGIGSRCLGCIRWESGGGGGVQSQPLMALCPQGSTSKPGGLGTSCSRTMAPSLAIRSGRRTWSSASRPSTTSLWRVSVLAAMGTGQVAGALCAQHPHAEVTLGLCFGLAATRDQPRGHVSASSGWWALCAECQGCSPWSRSGQEGLGQPSDQRPLQWGQMEHPWAYLFTAPGWGDRTRVYEGHLASGTIITPRK